MAQKKLRAVIKGGTYEFLLVWHGNGGGRGGGVVGWNCCSWHPVTRQHISRVSVKSQLGVSWFIAHAVFYNIGQMFIWQIKQQPVTIALVVSVGTVSVNHQSSIMVRYRWCIGRQSASFVQPRPLAFPCDTRNLSTNSWWTLLLVIHQLRLIP